jgi:predicted restriction endonuclease
LTTERIVRTTQVVRNVKQLHRSHCQICGETIETPGGSYAEGAHIQPLGRPHDGPDVEANVICLCPSDHVRFDYGAIVLTEDLTIVDALTGRALGTVRSAPGHVIDPAYIRHHRGRFAP